MKTVIRVVAISFVSFCLMLTAQAAGEATLSGIVKGVSGRSIQGAEIRIQGKDANKIGRIHTDANGHYSYPALETGTYSVTLVVDGTVKALINNVRTNAGEIQTLNFDLQGGAAARPFAKGKHYVWIPHQTGSHLGVWVEVEDDGKVMPSGMAERLSNQGNTVVRQIQSNSATMPNPR